MGIDWHTLASFSIYTLAALLCLVGFFASCLSFSGTWLVFVATGLIAWDRWPAFPGVGTLIAFLLICIGVEVMDMLAGSWGVQKRGGSKATGWATLGGGMLGMLGGGLIPIPVIGSLIGMIVGSFVCAFLAEHARMKKVEHAAHVATGAVLARLGVIFMKVGVTLLMTIILVIGIASS